jgi:hypothetical protein
MEPTDAASGLEPLVEDSQVIDRRLIELAEFSEYLGFEDQNDLRTYFRTNGTAACYGLSPTGSVIARMKLFTDEKSSRECERCGGNAEYKRPGCGFEDGNGNGQSPELAAILERFAADNPTLPPAADGKRVCRDCRGTGWVVDAESHAKGSLAVRIIDKRLGKQGKTEPAWVPTYRADEWKANPTGSSKRGGGASHALGESDVALLGRVSKRLEYVRSHESTVPARSGLERFYAEGANGLLSLWDLMPAGRLLLKRRKGSVPVEQFFQNERADQGRKGDKDRAELFDAADFQAKEVLKFAHRLYNKAKQR